MININDSTTMQHPSSGAGFTLIELIVTVAILGVLASLMLPLTQLATQRSKEHDLRIALREVRLAIDSYKIAVEQGRIKKTIYGSGYPPDLITLVEGVDDMKSPNKTKIYFLRRVPRDPFSHDKNLSPDQTWGLRSYSTPPDDPSSGDDVYDIYSLNTYKGLNGIPYNEW